MFERKREWRGLKIFGIIITTAFIAGLLVLFAIPKIFSGNTNSKNDQNINYNSQNIAPQPLSYQTGIIGGDTIITSASSKVLPAVVGISALTLSQNQIFDSGGAGQWEVGSGVIVSSNGYIVTNNHVAGGKSKIVVTLENGNVVEGKTVWADSILDLAIVKIDAKGLPIAALGDNNNVKVGDIAIAIGNPLGLQFQRTVTSGIISGLNRTISVDASNGRNFMEDLIQTDANINPGNSGGPLVNANGEVIGINTVKIQTAEGMGFAIPINIVKPIVSNFISSGTHVSPYIGIFAYDRNVMNYIDNTINLDKGIYCSTVDTNGPAFKSGIRQGDVITNIDNIEINTMMDLRTYIFNKGVGKQISISYYTNGVPKTAVVTLAAKPDNSGIAR